MAIIFQHNYSLAAYPNAGWGSSEEEELGIRFNRSRIAAGGPSGQDVLRFDQISALGEGDFGGQFNWGNRANLEAVDPPSGSSRFFRWRNRVRSTSNLRATSWEDGSDARVINKQLIVGQGGSPEPCRFILTLEGVNDTQFYWRLQIDGGDDLVDTVNYTLGDWQNIQIEIKSSNPVATPNAYYKIWVDNDVYASPTAINSGFVLNNSNWKFQWFGGFNNQGLRVDGVYSWEHADFQVGDLFDANWDSGEGEGGGASSVTGKPGLGSVFTMTQNVPYTLPAQKCTLFTTDTTATIQQSNTPDFASPIAVTLSGGMATLYGSYVRCTSGNITASIKAG